jgi:hypothetical protein
MSFTYYKHTITKVHLNISIYGNVKKVFNVKARRERQIKTFYNILTIYNLLYLSERGHTVA